MTMAESVMVAVVTSSNSHQFEKTKLGKGCRNGGPSRFDSFHGRFS